VKRVWVEFAATLAALAAVSVYMQLQDPTSWLRLRIAVDRERLRDWRIRAAVEEVIESATEKREV
jgi:hypothetical protein